MLTEARLIFLILYVSDLAASREFYEGALGFHVLEEDGRSVRYSAGHLVLCLYRAADFGIRLSPGRDRSIDITFLADDLEGMRAELESRGVRFSPTLTYIVGMTADFYDPDGHWFSLYEPSETVMSWPSGEKIKALRLSRDANRLQANGASPSSGAHGGLADRAGLDDHELVYLFLFVQDHNATLAFYHEVLGLEPVEGGPCRRGVTSAPDGVVKYDAGGTLLTTHHLDADHAASHRVTTEGSVGAALVFHVTDIRRVVAGLSLRGVEFSQGLTTSEIGTMARFEDPSGHIYHLYEPSAKALMRPSGSVIQRILASPV